MLDIVAKYAIRWQCKLNADKSVTMVLGETLGSNQDQEVRLSRKWMLGDQATKEVDEQHHLGILRTVYATSVHRTVERCMHLWKECIFFSQLCRLQIWISLPDHILQTLQLPVHSYSPVWG